MERVAVSLRRPERLFVSLDEGWKGVVNWRATTVNRCAVAAMMLAARRLRRSDHTMWVMPADDRPLRLEASTATDAVIAFAR